MRTRRLIGATLAASASVVLLAATPAAADITWNTTTHTDTTGIELVPGGTATVVADGLRVTTPDATAKVDFRVPVFDPAVDKAIFAALVEDMSYKTIKHDTAAEVVLPAYKVEFACDEAHPYATLVFEPYLQDSPPSFDQWRTWDVIGGKFWATKDLGGGFGGPVGSPGRSVLWTWDEILEQCPLGVVLSYGAGQGSSNTGADATLDAVRFAGIELTITDDETDAAKTAALTQGAVTGTPIADEHVWRLPPPADPAPNLPQTGFGATSYVLAGLALIMLGAVAVFLARRRRTA